MTGSSTTPWRSAWRRGIRWGWRICWRRRHNPAKASSYGKELPKGNQRPQASGAGSESEPMKITDRSHVQDPRLEGATPVEPPAPRPAEPDAPESDRVDLSDAARRLAALALAAPADDPER